MSSSLYQSAAPSEDIRGGGGGPYRTKRGGGEVRGEGGGGDEEGIGGAREGLGVVGIVRDHTDTSISIKGELGGANVTDEIDMSMSQSLCVTQVIILS